MNNRRYPGLFLSFFLGLIAASIGIMASSFFVNGFYALTGAQNEPLFLDYFWTAVPMVLICVFAINMFAIKILNRPQVRQDILEKFE